MVVASDPQSLSTAQILPLADTFCPWTRETYSSQNDRDIPVQRLPDEILLYIFVWYTSWSEPDWQTDKHIDRRPILLSHVCSRWRRIVLESSTLWTCIPFHDNTDARTTIIHRSREQSVDIIHCAVSGTISPADSRMLEALENIADRWRSVLWDSREEPIRGVLSMLDNVASMPRLHTLEIGMQTRTHPEEPLFLPANSRDDEQNLFPNLQHICLSRISLAELPITTLPRLRTLTLHWPALNSTLFRMSTLLKFLQRAPRIESLKLLKSCPLMDVLPRRLNNPVLAPMNGHGPQGNLFAPIRMSSLQYLEWSYAPPRDLHRLLPYLDIPNIRYLELRLDVAEQRWLTFYDGHLEPYDSDAEEDLPLLSQGAQSSKRHLFNQLRELHLYASDINGLCLAVRHMAFPRLRRLKLAFMRKRALRLASKTNDRQRSNMGALPPLDSIFHEPRLATLVHLTLSEFDIDHSTAICTLAYLRFLEHLTLDKCEGACQMICALAGAKCGSALGVSRNWTCPHLQHLDIVDCKDVTFNCLREAVFVRKMYVEGRVQDKRASRPVKPLGPRRATRLSLPNKTDIRSGDELTSECDLSELYAIIPSHPFKRIRSIVLHGSAISEEEALSLQDNQYDVNEILWSL